MPVSIQPPPQDGSLSPSGSPPSVTLEITVPGGGPFVARLITSSRPIFLERGLLPPGTTKVRIFLPHPLPTGAKLNIFASDLSGEYGVFTYSL